jgi:hypothetical protein
MLFIDDHEDHDQADLAVADQAMNARRDQVRHPGLEQRGAEDEDREHGDHRRRGEALERLAGRHIAGEHQHHQAEKRCQIDGQPFGQEQVDHSPEEGEQSGNLESHSRILGQLSRESSGSS